MTPRRYDASDPHPRRGSPPPAAIVDALQAAFAATPLPATGDRLRAAIDVADGRNLLISIGHERMDMFGEAGASIGDDDDANLPLERGVEALVPFLVDLTGWEAESEVLIYDFEGACPRCGRGFYDWESACRDCGLRLDGSIDPGLCQRRAQALLGQMLAAGLVEWEEETQGLEAAGDLVAGLAGHIERHGGAIDPAQVLRIIEASPRVAEVYGAEDDVRAAWAHVAP